MRVVTGYANGMGENPTYNDYAQKGYIEVVQIAYDPSAVDYSALLDIFWRQIDPTDPSGQFYDRGPQYKTAILYHSAEQKSTAEESKRKLQDSGKFPQKIVTDIVPFSNFYPAEQYHQEYYKKNPEQYARFRKGSGRDEFLERFWGESH